MTTSKKLFPVHPGEILKEDLLKEMGIAQHQLAESIGEPASHIDGIINGKQSLSADTALRLAKFFRMSPQFWLGLQTQYDLDETEEKIRDELDRIVPYQAAVP